MPHTPGPWKVANTLPRRSNFQPNARRMVTTQDGGERVAIAESRFRAEADANARLIAAAPELLAALVEALAANDFSLTGGHGPVSPWVAQAQAAVSAASEDR